MLLLYSVSLLKLFPRYTGAHGYAEPSELPPTHSGDAELPRTCVLPRLRSSATGMELESSAIRWRTPVFLVRYIFVITESI